MDLVAYVAQAPAARRDRDRAGVPHRPRRQGRQPGDRRRPGGREVAFIGAVGDDAFGAETAHHPGRTPAWTPTSCARSRPPRHRAHRGRRRRRQLHHRGARRQRHRRPPAPGDEGRDRRRRRAPAPAGAAHGRGHRRRPGRARGRRTDDPHPRPRPAPAAGTARRRRPVGAQRARGHRDHRRPTRTRRRRPARPGARGRHHARRGGRLYAPAAPSRSPCPPHEVTAVDTTARATPSSAPSRWPGARSAPSPRPWPAPRPRPRCRVQRPGACASMPYRAEIETQYAS